MAVAMASTAQRTISSNTATPSTSRAKRVCRILRSKKMREMTGIEVTATAMLITSNSEARLDFTPINQPSGSTDPKSQHDEERQRRPYGGQPANLLSLMLLEERLGLRAGKKHQHEQAEIIEKIERSFLLRRGHIKLEEVRVSGPSTENKWPKDAARENLSDYPRLPQSRKEVAE